MKDNNAFAVLPVVRSEEEFEKSLAHIPRCGPRGGLAVVVEDQDCVKIPLTQGKFALIEIGDYNRIGCFRWRASKRRNTWYAVGYVDGKSTYMHRFIHPDFDEVDHKNWNGIDNRRRNLRQSKHSNNIQNQPPRNRRFKGIRKNRTRWQALIGKDGVKHIIGSFGTQEEAARAYDEKAKDLYGETARLNFPQ